MNKKRLEYFKGLLLEEKERLEQHLARLEQDFKTSQQESSSDLSAYPLHMADLGTETAKREENSLFTDEEEKRRVLINEALKKIYSGEYGKCENCASTISEERLEAIPYARLCIKCKEKKEKDIL